VYLCISLVDCIKNYSLNALVPGPGFSVLKLGDVGVGSEEWVEDTSLVFLDEVFIHGF